MEKCLTDLNDPNENFTTEFDLRCRKIINTVAMRIAGAAELDEEVRFTAF